MGCPWDTREPGPALQTSLKAQLWPCGEEVSCRLLVWWIGRVLGGWLPVSKAQGHCLCNHRLSLLPRLRLADTQRGKPQSGARILVCAGSQLAPPAEELLRAGSPCLGAACTPSTLPADPPKGGFGEGSWAPGERTAPQLPLQDAQSSPFGAGAGCQGLNKGCAEPHRPALGSTAWGHGAWDSLGRSRELGWSGLLPAAPGPLASSQPAIFLLDLCFLFSFFLFFSSSLVLLYFCIAQRGAKLWEERGGYQQADISAVIHCRSPRAATAGWVPPCHQHGAQMPAGRDKRSPQRLAQPGCLPLSLLSSPAAQGTAAQPQVWGQMQGSPWAASGAGCARPPAGPQRAPRAEGG